MSALRRAGIQAVVIKGLPLAYLGYGDILSRHAGGIDLLVGPDQVLVAAQIFDQLGLELRSWPNGPPVERIRTALGHAAALPALHEVRFTGDGTTVGLQWRLFEDDRLCPSPAPCQLQHPQYVRLGGTVLPVLPLPLLWHLIAVQGTLHAWRRLKWIADVPALIGRHPELIAPGQPIDPSVITALRVAERVLGPFLPVDSSLAASGSVVGAGRVPHRMALGVTLLERRALRRLADDVQDAVPAARVHATQLHDAQLHDAQVHDAQVHDPTVWDPTAWDRQDQREIDTSGGLVLARLALRTGAAYRWAELRLLLLHVGQQRLVADPGPLTLVLGPARYLVRRTGERLGRLGNRAGAGWLHAETVVELGRTCVQLRLLPQHRVVRLLGSLAPLAGPVSPEQARTAATVGRVVTRTARRLPWHPTCVQQGLAAARILRRRRIPGRLYLGVADPATRSAQAWLTVGDEVVLEARGADRLTALAGSTPPARWSGRSGGAGTG